MTEELLHIAPGQDGWIVLHDSPRDSMVTVHRHTELEINLVTRGKATYLVGNQRISMQRDTLLWLFASQEHVLLNQSDDFTMWIVVFRPSMVTSACNTAQTKLLCEDDPEQVLCKLLAQQDAMRLDQLFDQVHQMMPIDQAHHNAGLRYLLTRAWLMHRQADAHADTTNVHAAVQRAALLLRHHTEPIGLDALGAQCGLSPARLSRLFKQQTGVALTEFRNRCRIDRFLEIDNRHAQRGNRSGQKQQSNMTQSALAAGFGSYPQFHRVFKQLMGMGPATYRRAQKAQSKASPIHGQ